ncbi:MAG: hypothetical protein M0Z38_02055 [Deltaproteobacteria bacterium]|nr:hypothetical protein [Deltaproteobacteria bacterium]
MKKNAKSETRHLSHPHNKAATVCGREIGKILLWAKKGAPKADDATVCGRCRKLAAGQAAKIEKAHQEIRKATKAMATEAIEGAAKVVRSAGKRQPALLILGDRMPRVLEVLFKGKTHQAEVIQEEGVATGAVRGTIRIDGQLFNSPSRAGKSVAGREVDGWTFWSYATPEGGLEKLDALRKAVA